MNRHIALYATCLAIGMTPAWILATDAAKSGQAKPPRPEVEVLSDDCVTRGHWRPAYGSYLHVLPAMKGYAAITGGHGWPMYFRMSVGTPNDAVRAWPSPIDYWNDDRALYNPLSRQHTGGSFDDHGEAHPIGQGPNLFIELLLPRGRFLVSLYFFEIDWIQYRAYEISISDRAGNTLARTNVDNFFEGKYKRFLAFSRVPQFLRIQILRGDSPNALVSGIFADALSSIDAAPLDPMQVTDVVGNPSKELVSLGNRLLLLRGKQNLAPAQFGAKHRPELEAIREDLLKFFSRYRTVSEHAYGEWILSECCEELLELKSSRDHYERFVDAFVKHLVKRVGPDKTPDALKALAERMRADGQMARAGLADLAYVDALHRYGAVPTAVAEAKRLADNHHEAKTYDFAVRLYRTLFALDPETKGEFDTAFRFAESLEKTSDYQAAAVEYDALAAGYPNHKRTADVLYRQYWTWNVLGNFPRSNVALDRLIAKAPRNRTDHFRILLAKNYYHAGDHDSAERLLLALMNHKALARDDETRKFAQAVLSNVRAAQRKTAAAP